MSAQTTYNFATPFGAAGGIVDLAPYAIDTFSNEENDGVVKPGCAVVTGTAAGKGVKLAGATTDAFEGIVVANRTTEMDRNGKVEILNKAPVGVMRYGKIYGLLATGVTPTYGAQVYVVLSSTDKGKLTTSSSSTLPINARFVSAANNGVAMIELYRTNILDKDTVYTPPVSGD